MLGALFGEFDANLVQIENRLGVLIAARGNKVVIEGGEDDVARARDVLVTMHERLLTGQALDSGTIEALIAMSNEPTLEGIITGEAQGPPIMIRTRRKTIVPRTAMQADYMRQLASRDMIFALGPAGTGKTYLAVAQAVSQLITGSVQRLILSRPAVEAGERLGFLPGDMKEKVDPYLRPLYDALLRLHAARAGRPPHRQRRDRDRPDRLHAWPHAQRRVRDPRRGTEHHPRADEDVPDPVRPEQPHGDLRRPQADRHPRRRHAQRADRCGGPADGS
jgi:phosphate starvation-inducible protein PhoH